MLKDVYYIFFILLALNFGCDSDISLVDQSETRVVVDSFIQPNPIEKLDILVALDTSGSMSDNYEDVGNGMDLLRMDVEAITLDYRFGFITADSTYYNYLGPYDSHSSSIDLLMAPSLLGNQHGEEAFASTYTFFNSEEIGFFRRDDADFLLFLVSDEDEQSAITPEMFRDWMHQEFKDVKHDVISITQSEDNTCGYSYEIGYKYISLANLYGKDFIDICSEDWSIWLSQSSFLTALVDNIKLSEKPILDSIVVYLNSEIILGWSYNVDENTVYLNSILNHGDLVEVGYEVEE
jgi:hypothetical protein